ncbi:hypothetical protein COCOR_05473 [Corallococcus coralloides DSM 2259]|uniref:Uncharacterized protein n=1 Tax=Corallococcus coralloides (strain ATCC 25202 / DSM 2259 / NBRC 100086 / M2) TaxID=1144275 RepID=H8MZ37_CORCM|nr:hypothetical protein COCOR_05473 [Corallococcus coralloides DSM 2259]
MATGLLSIGEAHPLCSRNRIAWDGATQRSLELFVGQARGEASGGQMSATRVDQPVCGDCGRAVDLYGGQSAMDGLGYWAAYRCEHCGGPLEMDGIGMPPESSRQALLREEGTWGLDVDERRGEPPYFPFCSWRSGHVVRA